MVSIDELREFMRGFSGKWVDKFSNREVNVVVTEIEHTKGIAFYIDFGTWLCVENNAVSENVAFHPESDYQLMYSHLASSHSYEMARLVCNDIDTLRVLLNAGTFSWLRRPDAV